MNYDATSDIPALPRLEVQHLPAKITPPSRDDLAKLHHSGKSQKEIAKSLGVSERTLNLWMRENGFRRHFLPIPDRDDIARRYADGETIRDIALSYGGSEPWMQRHFARYGIETIHGSRRLSSKIRTARTVEARGLRVSQTERDMAALLAERSVTVAHQKAIGPYNVDLAAGTVAVEIFGGGWHNARDEGERVRYLLDRGWSVVIVWVDTAKYPLSADAADYVVAHLKLSESDPAAARGYRVIRGSGELVSIGGLNGDDVPDVLTRCYSLDIPESVPYGTCHCGCGQMTWIADFTNRRRGWVQGEPVKWVAGHFHRGAKWTTDENGRRQYRR